MDIVDAMRELGFDKRLAILYQYMLKRSDGFEIDIERNTELRQPEVSMAIREMIQRDWIILDPRKQSGSRGRPKNYYYFSIEKARDDIKKIIEETENKIKEIKKVLL